MKTLFKIFFKDFHFNVLKILLLMITSFVIALYAPSIGLSPQISTIVTTLSVIVLIFSPSLLLFVNTKFYSNVPWLLNQNFNRTELLKFFLLSQFIRFILMNFLYLCYTFIIFLIPTKIEPLFDSHITAMDYYYLYFVLVGGWIFFLLPMHVKYANQLQSQKILKLDSSNVFIILALISFVITSKEPVLPDLYYLMLFLGSWAFFVTQMFNFHFKLFPEKKMKIYSLIISIIIILPAFGGIEVLKNIVLDPRYSTLERADIIIGLDELTPNLEKKEKINLLLNSTPSTYRSLLKIFGNDLTLEEIFSATLNPRKAQHFINYASRPYSLEDVSKIIHFMTILKKKYSLGYDFDRYSYSFFNQQECDRPYLESLIANPESFSQLGAIYMAHKNLKKEEFISFYQAHVESLSPSIKADEHIQKWLKN